MIYPILKRLFLFFLVFSAMTSKNVYSENDQIRSIMIGHLYPIMDNKKILQSIYEKFDSLDPDYIFILGDSNLHKKEIVENWRRKYGEKIFFVPGNHEVRDGKLDEFLENVGYLQKIIEEKHVRFLLANSNSDASELNIFLNRANINKDKKHNILLLHHRIWDDTLTSRLPYQHDKSYYLKDIFPYLEKNISTIFAGNSKHQYFFDDTKTQGNQNMNSIYWVDRIGNINAYSIGIGTGIPKIGFVEVLSKENYPAIVIPHHIKTKWDDPLPINKQIKASSSVPPKDSILFKEHNLKNLFLSLRSTVRYFLATYSGSFFGAMTAFFLIRKFTKK